MTVMQRLHTIFGFIWASPWTAVGLCVGAAGLLTGARVQRRDRIVEFHGGGVAWLLSRLPSDPMAMTVGHTVLGITSAALDVCRKHELVHVRQYELWGPFFVPAYLGASAWIWFAGGDAYRDNPFEREAFSKAP